MAATATKKAAAAQTDVVITFKLEKQTKNALRYQEELTKEQEAAGSRGLIGTLYVQKSTLTDSPERIQATITRL